MGLLMQIVFIALLGALITIVIGVFKCLIQKVSKMSDKCTYLEAKMDIYLDHAGFDVQKVNSTIKDHLVDLMKNNRPSVGCINVKELYKPGQGGQDADSVKPG